MRKVTKFAISSHENCKLKLAFSTPYYSELEPFTWVHFGAKWKLT